MTATYSFAIDHSHSMMRVTLAGFFTAEDIAAFVAAQKDAHRQLGCAPNQHLTLADVRGMVIQSQESVKAFQKLLSDPRANGRRIAFVVTRSLARMQAQRAAQGRGAGYFTTSEAAEAWLLSDEAAAAA